MGLGKQIGKIVELAEDIQVDLGSVITGPLNQLWRAKILYNRATSGKEKVTQSNQPPATEGTTTEKRRYRQIQVDQINQARSEIDANVATEITKPFDGKRPFESFKRDTIMIIPRDNLEDIVQLQCIPSEIEVSPESNFVTIQSIGRNNPFYHYMGSEDIINFSISWYANEKTREDVIRNCKKLESFTKSDGYTKSVPILWIKWSSKDTLFRDADWLCTNAPYTLSHFQDAYRDGDQAVRIGLLPCVAIQKLTFKRVTKTNLTTQEQLWKPMQ